MPAKLRNLELALLVLAISIDLGTIALVQLGALGALDSTMLVQVGMLGVLVIVVHVVLRVVARDADPLILPIATVLNGLGIAMIYRVDLAFDLRGWDNGGVRQVAWTALSIVIAIAVLLLVRNHRVLQRYTYIAMASGILLLVLPMLPIIGSDLGTSAQLWM